MSEIDELVRLAKAATPGPWEAHSNTRFVIGDTLNKRSGICDWEKNAPQAEANCKFIAAANPKTVLEMIGEISELQSALIAANKRADEAWNAAIEAAADKLKKEAASHYRLAARPDRINFLEAESLVRAITRPTPPENKT